MPSNASQKRTTTMPLTDVELCSAALVKIGAAVITSFEDESAEADIAKRLYEPTLQGLITSHPWHFTLAQSELAALDEAPQAGFSRVFELPQDALRTISAGADSRATGSIYHVAGSRLFADASRIFLSYQRRPATAEFPPFFVQALITRLAAEFCLPLTEGTSRSEVLYRLAAAELRVAKLADSQQATPRAVDDFTLIMARSR